MADGPRIRVMGSTGAGKTIAARSIAAAMGVPFLELDNINWYPTQPMYRRERSNEESASMLAEFLAANDAWVIEGSYRRFSGPALEVATEAALLEPRLYRRAWRLAKRWWVGRRGLTGGDDASVRAFLELQWWAVWGSRYARKSRVETLEASGVPWTHLRTNAEIRAYLERFPGAWENFERDVERGKREPEAVISGRRPPSP